MQPARQVIREFRWKEIFPCLMLIRVFRCSLRIHALVLSLIATILITQGWKASAILCLPETDPIRVKMQLEEREPFYLFVATEMASTKAASGIVSRRVFDPFLQVFEKFALPVREFFAPQESYAQRGYYLLGFGWTLLVGSFFAGVICRTAAFDLASQERYGVFRAIRFVTLKMRSFLAAPLMPLLVLLGLLLPIFLLGLLTTNVSPFVASLLWGFAIVWGLLLGVVGMTVLFSWPLLWPALASEDSDSFDAIGNAFGYVSQRPFSYFLYVLIAAVVTSAGLILFSMLIHVGMSLLHFGMFAGGGREVYWLISVSSRSQDKLSTGVMNFWEFFASFLTDAYLFSAFWTSATGIFLLLRQDVDGAELDDIFREGADDERPMPKLAREMGLTGEAASMTAPAAPPAESTPKAD
jgi:hypothetical protein